MGSSDELDDVTTESVKIPGLCKEHTVRRPSDEWTDTALPPLAHLFQFTRGKI